MVPMPRPGLFALPVAFCFFSVAISVTGPLSAAELDWDRGNLIANGRFEDGDSGELPKGWTVVAPNPALSPRFALERESAAKGTLTARGNGRAECFGYVKHTVRLLKDKTYRLRVRLRCDGLEDLNRHLVHAVHGYGFNDGI